MLAPVPLRPSRSYELQGGVVGRQERSRRAYHHVRRSATSVRDLEPLGAPRTPTCDIGTGDASQRGRQDQLVLRRYFFRGLEGYSNFPAAAHFDCILQTHGKSEPESQPEASPRRGSFPVTPPDQPGAEDRRQQNEPVITRCNFIDTLANSVAACDARGSGSVKVTAEDLSAAIATARPFTRDDALPMCVLFQELLKLLTAGRLEIIGREAEKLADELRLSKVDSASLRASLADHTQGIEVKLRRIEGRLAAERKSADLLQNERDALAKENDELRFRLRSFEPDDQHQADAMARARSLLTVRGGLIEDLDSIQRRRLKNFLSHVTLLASLDEADLEAVAAQLQQITFTAGSDIVVEGDTGDCLYIVDEGRAVATKRSIVGDDGAPQVLMTYEPGDWFGELALLENQERAATVCAIGEMKCLKLPRNVFEDFLGSKCIEILKRDQNRYAKVLCGVTTKDQEQATTAPTGQVDSGCVSGSMDFLAELAALPGGSQCADCRDANPTWGSSNTGALICLRCSEIHRMLGHEHSKVLSVKLDSWEVEEAATMRSEGNAALNGRLEHCLKADDKPKPWSKHEVIEDFIYSKYVARCFVEGGSGTIEEPPWIRRVAVPTEITAESAAAAFLRRLQSGEVSEDELHALSGSFLQHAKDRQLQELLDTFMDDERAASMMRKMMENHEHRSRQTTGLLTKATSSIAMQMKVSSELHTISEKEQEEAGSVLEADFETSGVSSSTAAAATALKSSMQAAGFAGSMASAFAQAQEKRTSERSASLKRGLRASVMGAGQVLGLQQQLLDAHARDFTVKQWRQKTKALCGTALYDALHPPVEGFPCEKAMKLSSMKKLVSKIYEAYCCEFFDVRNGRGKHGGRPRPPLQEYVEDYLLLQYGMPSLARKTLLQMVATVHKYHCSDSRVRGFAELVGMVPQSEMIKVCSEQAQDFYMRFLTLIFPTRKKISDCMSSVRTNSISIATAENLLSVIYHGILPREVVEALAEISDITDKGARVIAVDKFLELVMRMWSNMVGAQRLQLDTLFKTHDDGDGQLSFSEFSVVIHAATAEVSQSEILDLYKRCLAQSHSEEHSTSEIQAGNEDSTDGSEEGSETESSMDAIKPEAFRMVVLPHVLRSMQQTLH